MFLLVSNSCSGTNLFKLYISFAYRTKNSNAPPNCTSVNFLKAEFNEYFGNTLNMLIERLINDKTVAIWPRANLVWADYADWRDI